MNTQNIRTWEVKTGEWKATFEVYIGKGRNKEDAIKDLQYQVNINYPPRDYDICDDCDVIHNPLCNRCLGS